MYQCPKCKGWIEPHDDTYSHACTDTLQRIAAKVAEHKELQADPDYQLAKAAFTVMRELKPDPDDPAFERAQWNQFKVWKINRIAWHRARDDTKHLTPRRRGQDKKENAGD